MQPQVSDTYDVIIIGAGVGGLTCGLYLAQAGLKTLILERHGIAGGYASSFTKKGFYFDAAAHYLSSCRERGQLGRLIRDHDLLRYFSLERCDPSDTLIFPEHHIELRTDFSRLVETFQQAFPHEAANIQRFFKYIATTEATQLYLELKDYTFAELMATYLKDFKLKAILEILLGNIGAPASRASALSAAFLFREYIFDGGYYPKGGMQAFCDALVKRFTDYGGIIAFGTPAKRIRLDGRRVSGVVIKGDRFVSCKHLVSNCDPFQTFCNLINGFASGDPKIQDYVQRLKTAVPSISAFMVHLGTTEKLGGRLPYRGCIWYCPTYDVKSYYSRWMDGIVDFEEDGFIFASSPSRHDNSLAPEGKDSLQLIIGTAYKSREFWEKHREQMATVAIKRAEHFIYRLSEIVEFRLSATPQTLQKYTLNYQGAMYGWAPLPTQVGRRKVLAEDHSLEGLYFAGQWSGPPAGTGGIPMAVYSGRDVAVRISRRSKRS